MCKYFLQFTVVLNHFRDIFVFVWLSTSKKKKKEKKGNASLEVWHARQSAKIREEAASRRVGGAILLGNRVTLVYASLCQFTQAMLR